jgi:hypothetical protein
MTMALHRVTLLIMTLLTMTLLIVTILIMTLHRVTLLIMTILITLNMGGFTYNDNTYTTKYG